MLHNLKGVVIILGFFLGSAMPVLSQTGVLNPNDPIVVYNPQSPPSQPPWGQMGKWVKTNRLSWSTTSFKAYIYKGLAFRLKFPKTYVHGVADGKTYPVILFQHGIGEKGSVYDNEYQLLHGGQKHRDAVDLGNFDGFLFYPQSVSGWFGSAQYALFKEIIENFLVPQVKADINRIYVHGLSGGGSSSWDIMIQYPKLIAAALPMSAAYAAYGDQANVFKHIAIWHFQGGLDPNPNPGTSRALGDRLRSVGANYRYTEYPNLSHGTWNTAYNEPDFFPFMLRAHKANPWVLFGRTEFCQGDAINVRIGVTAGFDGYEWRRNGQPIAGSANEITATSLGTYDCRIRRGSVWSPWSPRPVELKIKGATVSPAIQVAGLMSKVIPVPDGNTGVTLSVPTGYTSYIWQKVGSTTTLSTVNTLYASSPGDYIVKVTEQFGCTSSFSSPFKVINANGTNKPDPASNLGVTTLSFTSLRLNWTNSASPAFNETNFEVYRAIQAGGPYTLIAITGADVNTYTANGLTTNTRYYFRVRAVNNTAAAAVSNEASGSTAADGQAPTPPSNLRVTASNSNSVSLAWNAASDNIAVTNYEIYVNGLRSYVSSTTQSTVYSLEPARSYNFVVRAKDAAGNQSPSSNQVTGVTASGPAPAPFAIHVNFNRDNPAATPWNNTNSAPMLNAVYANLRNAQNNSTGVNMTVTKDFSGDNPFGMNTGNNSGVYPDNVIRSTWWVDAGITSQLKISGLNLGTNYTFVFFGSRDGAGDRTTIYTINGTSVSLNCAFNISQTAQINNVVADGNGEVLIDIGRAPTSQFGYIGALVIKTSGSGAAVNELVRRGADTAFINSNDSEAALQANFDKIKGFPNPFTGQVTLTARFKNPQSRVTLRMVDIYGRLVYIKEFYNIPAGAWNQRLNLSDNVLQPGVYQLQMTGPDLTTAGSFKLLKVNK